jgi:tRNA G46 methylase TrmB
MGNRDSLLARIFRRPRKRKVYVDVGANTGEALVKFASSHPDLKLFAIEPNPKLLGEIKRKAASGAMSPSSRRPHGRTTRP